MHSPRRQQNGGGGFLVTVSAILALFTSRLKGKPSNPKAVKDEWIINRKPPKKLLSNKTQKKKPEKEVEWGNGGVWQKEILMGGKCEPLNFSGVIYYDNKGKQMSEIPFRSPRASPLPGYLSRLQQQ